jgi:uncharacterized protein YjbJ (UPF0337 family)
MNKDRIAGATKETVGGSKEKAGKTLGDTEMEAEGKAKKVEGKIRTRSAGRGRSGSTPSVAPKGAGGSAGARSPRLNAVWRARRTTSSRSSGAGRPKGVRDVHDNADKRMKVKHRKAQRRL